MAPVFTNSEKIFPDIPETYEGTTCVVVHSEKAAALKSLFAEA
jgi:hypothetical protein